MKWSDVGGLVTKVAPWVAAAASGNVPALLGLAAGAVSKATGQKVDPAQDAIAAAVAGATPEQLIALKQADAELQAKLQEMGFQHEEDVMKLEMEDVANARSREIAIRDHVPAVMGYGVTLGFFGMLTMLWLHAPPVEVKDLMLTMLGALGAGWAAVISYYFGSSNKANTPTAK
jgi:hypothetical protein